MPMGRPQGYATPRNDPMSILAQMVSPEAILKSIQGQAGTSGLGYLDQAQALAGQMGNGNSLQAMMDAINQGYAPGLAAADRGLAQDRAQEDQDIADINSWFGQLRGEYSGAAADSRRSGKRQAKRTKKESRTSRNGYGGVGNMLLNRDANQAAASESRMGEVEGSMNSALAANTMNQADYNALVRSRIHAAEREGILAQKNALKSQKQSEKSQARASSKESEFAQVMALAQFLAAQGGQDNQLQDIGTAMSILQQGGASGMPGFERYAPEQQVDPAMMMQLYQGMIDPTGDPWSNMARLESASKAFDLPSGGQNDAMMNLVMQMSGGMGLPPKGSKKPEGVREIIEFLKQYAASQ